MKNYNFHKVKSGDLLFMLRDHVKFFNDVELAIIFNGETIVKETNSVLLISYIQDDVKIICRIWPHTMTWADFYGSGYHRPNGYARIEHKINKKLYYNYRLGNNED